MILIGMFDSPFVRRVAITLHMQGISFEHRNWSVGKDFELIRRYNPLGRVPTLVLDDGEALIDSAAILDYLDDVVGPARALVPPTGRPRRATMRLMAVAVGAAEKGVQQVYERVFRPEEKRHATWVERCRAQMHGALRELERTAEARREVWLTGALLTQADITVGCVYKFLCEAVGADGSDAATPGTAYPALRALSERCEALPAFRAVKADFHAP
jgi:glutathione S-transferase